MSRTSVSQLPPILLCRLWQMAFLYIVNPWVQESFSSFNSLCIPCKKKKEMKRPKDKKGLLFPFKTFPGSSSYLRHSTRAMSLFKSSPATEGAGQSKVSAGYFTFLKDMRISFRNKGEWILGVQLQCLPYS